MKYFVTLLLLISFSGFTMAATIKDVVLITTLEANNEVVLKLRDPSLPKDSFFFVVIDKSDPQAMEKTQLIARKNKEKDSFQLDLEIPSFSPRPSGSKYRSKSVRFIAGSEAN